MKQGTAKRAWALLMAFIFVFYVVIPPSGSASGAEGDGALEPPVQTEEPGGNEVGQEPADPDDGDGNGGQEPVDPNDGDGNGGQEPVDPNDGDGNGGGEPVDPDDGDGNGGGEPVDPGDGDGDGQGLVDPDDGEEPDDEEGNGESPELPDGAYIASFDSLASRRTETGTLWSALDLPVTLHYTTSEEERGSAEITGWSSEPEYDADEAGTYILTPQAEPELPLGPEAALPTLELELTAPVYRRTLEFTLTLPAAEAVAEEDLEPAARALLDLLLDLDPENLDGTHTLDLPEDAGLVLEQPENLDLENPPAALITAAKALISRQLAAPAFDVFQAEHGGRWLSRTMEVTLYYTADGDALKVVRLEFAFAGSLVAVAGLLDSTGTDIKVTHKGFAVNNIGALLPSGQEYIFESLQDAIDAVALISGPTMDDTVITINSLEETSHGEGNVLAGSKFTIQGSELTGIHIKLDQSVPDSSYSIQLRLRHVTAVLTEKNHGFGKLVLDNAIIETTNITTIVIDQLLESTRGTFIIENSFINFRTNISIVVHSEIGWEAIKLKRGQDADSLSGSSVIRSGKQLVSIIDIFEIVRAPDDPVHLYLKETSDAGYYVYTVAAVGVELINDDLAGKSAYFDTYAEAVDEANKYAADSIIRIHGKDSNANPQQVAGKTLNGTAIIDSGADGIQNLIGDITMNADLTLRNIELDGGVTMDGNPLTLDSAEVTGSITGAGGDLFVSGDFADANPGASGSSAGAISDLNHAEIDGVLTAASLAGVILEVNADGDLSASGDIDFTGGIDIEGIAQTTGSGAVRGDTLTVAEGGDLSAAGDVIINGNLAVSGAISKSARVSGTVIAVSGAINSSGDVVATSADAAGSAIKVDGGSINTAGDNNSGDIKATAINANIVVSDGGGITAGGALSATGALNLQSGANSAASADADRLIIASDASLSTNGAITATGTGDAVNVNGGQINAGGSVTANTSTAHIVISNNGHIGSGALEASGDITVNGTITASGALIAGSKLDIPSGGVTALSANAVEINVGSDSTTSLLTATGGVIAATGGNITVNGSVSATGAVSAAGDITVSGSVSAVGTVSAAGDIVVSGGSAVTSTGANVSAVNIRTSGAVSAENSNSTVSATQNLKIDGGQVTSPNVKADTIDMIGGTIYAASSIIADADFDIASGAVVSSASIQAAGINFGNSSILSDIITAGTFTVTAAGSTVKNLNAYDYVANMSDFSTGSCLFTLGALRIQSQDDLTVTLPASGALTRNKAYNLIRVTGTFDASSNDAIQRIALKISPNEYILQDSVDQASGDTFYQLLPVEVTVALYNSPNDDTPAEQPKGFLTLKEGIEYIDDNAAARAEVYLHRDVALSVDMPERISTFWGLPYGYSSNPDNRDYILTLAQTMELKAATAFQQIKLDMGSFDINAGTKKLNFTNVTADASGRALFGTTGNGETSAFNAVDSTIHVASVDFGIVTLQGGNVTANTIDSTVTDITVTGGSTVTATTSLTATNVFTVSGSGSTVEAGVIQAADITVTGSGSVTGTDSVTANGTLSVTGSAVESDLIKAANASLSGAEITLRRIEATGSFKVEARSNFHITGNHSDGNIALLNTVLDGNFDVPADGLNLYAATGYTPIVGHRLMQFPKEKESAANAAAGKLVGKTGYDSFTMKLEKPDSDANHYYSLTEAVDSVVVTVATGSYTYGDSVPVTAALYYKNNTAVSDKNGQDVTFYVEDKVVGTSTVNNSGVATFTLSRSANPNEDVYLVSTAIKPLGNEITASFRELLKPSNVENHVHDSTLVQLAPREITATLKGSPTSYSRPYDGSTDVYEATAAGEKVRGLNANDYLDAPVVLPADASYINGYTATLELDSKDKGSRAIEMTGLAVADRSTGAGRAANYMVTNSSPVTISGAYTVEPKNVIPLSFTVTKEYDGGVAITSAALAAAESSLAGVVEISAGVSEDVSLTLNIVDPNATPSVGDPQFFGKNVGDNALINTDGLWVLTGADAGNYALVDPLPSDFVKAEIEPRPLTINPEMNRNIVKQYDGSSAVTVPADAVDFNDDLLPGDVVAFVLSDAYYADSSAEAFNANAESDTLLNGVPYSLYATVAITGSDSDNYTFDSSVNYPVAARGVTAGSIGGYITKYQSVSDQDITIEVHTDNVGTPISEPLDPYITWDKPAQEMDPGTVTYDFTNPPDSASYFTDPIAIAQGEIVFTLLDDGSIGEDWTYNSTDQNGIFVTVKSRNYADFVLDISLYVSGREVVDDAKLEAILKDLFGPDKTYDGKRPVMLDGSPAPDDGDEITGIQTTNSEGDAITLDLIITYDWLDAGETFPKNARTYTVTATVDDVDYRGSAEHVFTIEQRPIAFAPVYKEAELGAIPAPPWDLTKVGAAQGDGVDFVITNQGENSGLADGETLEDVFDGSTFMLMKLPDELVDPANPHEQYLLINTRITGLFPLRLAGSADLDGGIPLTSVNYQWTHDLEWDEAYRVNMPDDAKDLEIVLEGDKGFDDWYRSPLTAKSSDDTKYKYISETYYDFKTSLPLNDPTDNGRLVAYFSDEQDGVAVGPYEAGYRLDNILPVIDSAVFYQTGPDTGELEIIVTDKWSGMKFDDSNYKPIEVINSTMPGLTADGLTLKSHDGDEYVFLLPITAADGYNSFTVDLKATDVAGNIGSPFNATVQFHDLIGLDITLNVTVDGSPVTADPLDVNSGMTVNMTADLTGAVPVGLNYRFDWSSSNRWVATVNVDGSTTHWEQATLDLGFVGVSDIAVDTLGLGPVGFTLQVSSTGEVIEPPPVDPPPIDPPPGPGDPDHYEYEVVFEPIIDSGNGNIEQMLQYLMSSASVRIQSFLSGMDSETVKSNTIPIDIRMVVHAYDAGNNLLWTLPVEDIDGWQPSPVRAVMPYPNGTSEATHSFMLIHFGGDTGMEFVELDTQAEPGSLVFTSTFSPFTLTIKEGSWIDPGPDPGPGPGPGPNPGPDPNGGGNSGSDGGGSDWSYGRYGPGSYEFDSFWQKVAQAIREASPGDKIYAKVPTYIKLCPTTILRQLEDQDIYLFLEWIGDTEIKIHGIHMLLPYEYQFYYTLEELARLYPITRDCDAEEEISVPPALENPKTGGDGGVILYGPDNSVKLELPATVDTPSGGIARMDTAGSQAVAGAATVQLTLPGPVFPQIGDSLTSYLTGMRLWLFLSALYLMFIAVVLMLKLLKRPVPLEVVMAAPAVSVITLSAPVDTAAAPVAEALLQPDEPVPEDAAAEESIFTEAEPEDPALVWAEESDAFEEEDGEEEPEPLEDPMALHAKRHQKLVERHKQLEHLLEDGQITRKEYEKQKRKLLLLSLVLSIF